MDETPDYIKRMPIGYLDFMYKCYNLMVSAGFDINQEFSFVVYQDRAKLNKVDPAKMRRDKITTDEIVDLYSNLSKYGLKPIQAVKPKRST